MPDEDTRDIETRATQIVGTEEDDMNTLTGWRESGTCAAQETC